MLLALINLNIHVYNIMLYIISSSRSENLLPYAIPFGKFFTKSTFKHYGLTTMLGSIMIKECIASINHIITKDKNRTLDICEQKYNQPTYNIGQISNCS